MSDHTKEPWRGRGTFIIAGPGEGVKILDVGNLTCDPVQGVALRARIVADHNACLGIPDPVSTIPKLVAFANAHHEFPGFLIKGQSGPTPI
jgi:hypothetical protein